MSRNHTSARRAGARFEQQIADYLATHVDERIERRTRNGAKDRGDITGLRHMTGRVTIECKNTARLELSRWAAEAETARGNDDALAGLIVSKRHGDAHTGSQWVHMRLVDLVALLTGDRPNNESEDPA